MFHSWISTDSDEHDTCLTCGGMWVATEDGHTGADGEPAVPCTGDTSQGHNYPGEHIEGRTYYPDCNCLFCQ